MSNKELSKKETVNLMTSADVLGEVGITSDDITVPKLFLMQNTSLSVGEGQAKLGDILNSETGKVIGGLEKPLEIIPLKNTKVWMVYDITQSPPKFIRRDDWSVENKSSPYEEIEKGVKIRRDMGFLFTILLKEDADKGEAYPCNILFKRTSAPAGKQLASLVFRRLTTGKSHLDYSAILSVVKQKTDSNIYALFNVAMGTKVSEKASSEANKWFNMLRSKKVVDEANPLDDVL